jgi:hypothetical protein
LFGKELISINTLEQDFPENMLFADFRCSRRNESKARAASIHLHGNGVPESRSSGVLELCRSILLRGKSSSSEKSRAEAHRKDTIFKKFNVTYEL